MNYIDKLVAELNARKVTPLDLEDTVHSLVHDRMADLTVKPLSDEAALESLAQAAAAETEALTQAGLYSQLSWMASYYNNADHLQWALSGFLRLPKAA